MLRASMPDSPKRPAGLLLGTPVLTLRGEVVAQALAIGAVLVVVSGAGAPYSRLRLKRMTRHDLRARPWARPLRIRADALENGVPMADVLVAPGQMLLLDGALVPAWRLEDGFGIAREAGLAEVIYVRLALEAQDAVVAAGLAVATDADIRDAGTAQPPCAPAIADNSLAALLAHLRLRAESLGWATPEAPPERVKLPGTSRARLCASAAWPLCRGPALPESFPTA